MPSKISQLALVVVLSAFVAEVLLDPSDSIFHLKLPLLVLLMCVWVSRVACGMVNPGGSRIWAFILLFALIIPGIATIVGLLGSSLPVGEPGFQMMKEFPMILLIPVVLSERVDLIKHIIRWSFVIAAFTLCLAVLSVAAPVLFSVVRDFTLEKDNAFIGTYDKLGMGFGSIYYRTAAILVFPVAHYLRNLLTRPRKLVSCILTVIFLVAVLLSGSRATVLGTFVVVAALVTPKLRSRFGLKASISILIVMIVLPLGYFVSFFHPEESSNAAKLGHIHSYAALFEDHPTYLLWGQGADTEFYTQGFEAKTTLTELTYLDIIRWFGIPVAVLIVIALLYPVFGLARQADTASYLVVPYVTYLCEAATNPLLICSFGALIVSAIWGAALLRNVKNPIPMTAEALI